MKYLILTILFLSSLSIFSQLQTNGGQSPNQLVQNVLIGPGVNVSNIFYSGANTAIGTFDASNASIGIDEGIIMTTGTINQGPDGPYGPNNSPNSGLDNNQTGYGVLENIVGTQTYNAAILEFDFVPLSDTVRFNYVFASEEYPEFVGSQFNDVFGFFITGPGIPAGGRNMAIIPGTTQEVAINNVNSTSNSNYFVDNGTGSNAPFNSNPFYVQYDGFTTPLQAVSAVECGETYHLVIALADVGDEIYDSGIFLEKNSLTSEQPVMVDYQLSADPYGDGQTMAQGCTSATFTVTRSGNISQPLTIPINVLGSATEGVDFTNIPISVTFPANQDQVTFTIDALNDPGLVGVENIIVQFEIPDPCGNNNFQTLELFIQEVLSVDVNITSEDPECPGDLIELSAFGSGGGGGYNYLWSTGDTSQTIFVSPNATQSFTVTATDTCLGESAQESVTVNVPVFEPLEAIASEDIVEQCPFVPFTISVDATGGSGTYSYLWRDNSGNVVGSGSAANVAPGATTTYTVTVTDNCGNSITDDVTITILSPPLILTISPEQEVCPGDSALLTVSATGGFGNYYYRWSHSNETTPSVWVNPNSTTSYTVYVEDDCGTFEVDATTKVTVVTPNADFAVLTDPLFTNLPITFQNLTDDGDSYQWSFGEGSTSTMIHPNNVFYEAGTYPISLIATDAKGCIDSITRAITILDEFYIYVPNTFTPDGNRFNNTWRISTINVVTFHLTVYNRWGELIFESRDPSFQWDGTYGGKVVPDGTYVWNIKYSSINNPEIEFDLNGHVTVLR
mgnify:CR=1 FL=1